ncbi:hypothetical protein CUPL110328_04230 [Cupriavidus plantarum]|nr:hypothetical protein LMG26296_03331 [Cupriavidus plantarum]SMR65625.1 hypothetical protein SAMN05421735_0475 [Cupriavidus plantarum]
MEIPVGGGLGGAARVAVQDIIRSPLGSIGRGVVGVARTTPGGIAAGIIGSILLEKGIQWVNGQWTKNGVPEQAPNGKPYPASGGYWNLGSQYISSNAFDTCVMYMAAQTSASGPNGTIYTVLRTDPAGADGAWCVVQRARKSDGVVVDVLTRTYQVGRNAGCAPTHSNVSGTCVPPGYVAPVDSAPATDTQIQQAITDKMTSSPGMAPDVVRNIYDNGGWVPVDAVDSASWGLPSTPVTGKSTVSSSNSTNANGDSITTTTTTTPTMTLGQTGNTAGTNTMVWNVTNNTTTTVTNNTTGESHTSTGQENDTVIQFTDSSMPELPKLYTQKYPQGIAGVWQANKPDVQATPFFQAVKTMFPTFGSGQCPVWRLAVNPGGRLGSYGSYDISVPCWIWQALGLVVLVTATFTARKIIF